MRHLAVALSAALILSVAACGGSATPSEVATRVEVTLTDALRIEPDALAVAAGVPVTFVVTNTGTLKHEFYLGDEDEQAAHGQEMASMGGMTHDDPQGIGLKPGETKELTYTFTSVAPILAGCHVQGHYLAGMKAAVTVL